jgi:DNA-binding SARP family transcriptional activator/tetratricopeptide (TPR) repeat protein
MIEFRALGSAELVHREGHPIASVLAQPKRLALLTYLAVAAPRRFQRRDTLLGLFWPESDAERARGALRQAVRFLRRSLGEGVLVNRGEDEIGVAADAIRCDVVVFDHAVDAGEPAAALACYRGDLLDGLFIDGAPEWERWLDGERLRLRRRAAACAARLADDAAAAGEWTAAVEFARRGCELAPDDESSLRRLLSCLAESGDRSGAAAEYERYAAWLATELELEPSAETRALLAGIRKAGDMSRPRPHARAATVPVEPVSAGEPATVTAEPVEAPHPAAPLEEALTPVPTRPASQRPRWRWAAAVLTVVLVGGAAWAAWPARAATPLHDRRFLVLPFENLTGDSTLDPLGRMTADRISQGLAGVGDIEVVPTMALLASARQLELDAGKLVSREGIAALAAEVGAGRLVSGSYYLQGGRLLFQARITSVTGGGLLRGIDIIDASPDSPMVAVEQLRTLLRAALAPVVDEESHARAGSVPPTYEAYRDYVAGMDAFVRRDLPAALRQMERAAAADTSWAMPLIVTAIVHMNLGDWAASDSVSRRVAPLREHLGPLELAMHDMMEAWIRGDDGAAYDAVVRQTRLAPGTIAHYQVAEQARRLNRPREALRVLRELAPGGEPAGELRGWRAYWREVTWSHHMLGDHRAELRAAREARRRYPHDVAVLLHEARALAALGRVEDVESLVQQRLEASTNVEPSIGSFMRTLGLELSAHGRQDAGQRLLERSADWYASRPPPERERYTYALATALYAAGRLEESRVLLERLAEERPDLVEAQAHLGLIAARTGDRERAVRVSEWLRTLERPYTHGQDTFWRALIAARLDEPAEAVRLIREAMAAGYAYTPGVHIEIDLQPLRDDAAFRALLRPAG